MRKIYTLIAAGLMAVPAMAQDVIREVITDPASLLDYPMTMPYDVTISGLSKDLRYGKDITFTDANGQLSVMVMDSRNPEAPVYLKDPLCRYTMGTYIEGRLVEDKDDIYLEFQLPQMLAVNAHGNGVMLAVGKIFVNEYGTFYDPVPYEQNLVKYVMDEDENWVLDLPEGYALCNWLLAAENTDYKEGLFWQDAITAATYKDAVQKLPVIMPEDATPQEYGMVFGNGERSKFVNVAFVGDKVYVEGFDKDYPTSCVVGTINGDKVTFEAGQYLGSDTSFAHYVAFNKAEFQSANQWGEELWEFPGNLIPSIEASYDATNKIISCPVDVAWFCNVGTSSLYYKSGHFYVGPLFAPYQNMPATPQNPEITELMPFEAGMGFGGVAFNLPLLGTNNEVLNPDLYTYVVYFDDEPYTFTPALYPGLEKPMTEIPYNFTDENEDIVGEGMEHIVIWRQDGFETIGIQAIYTVGESVNKSEIIKANLTEEPVDPDQPDVAVDGILADDVKNVEYFDMTGCKVSSPERGIYIRKISFENGKTITDKVVVR